MALALLDIAPDEGGGVRLQLAPTGWELCLTAEQARRRAAIAQAATVLRLESGGLGAYTGIPDQDAATARAEVAWRVLRAWDADHVVEPLVEQLPAREVVLAYPGESALTHFSVRAALCESLRSGRARPGVLPGLAAIPLWHTRALRQILEIAGEGALPAVEPSRLVMLIAPPAGSALLRALPRLPRDLAARVLSDNVGQLRQLARIDALQSLLLDLARSAGVEVVYPATRLDLLEHLGPPCAGRSLVLIAHQDERGVHFQDGPIELCALRAAFAERDAAGAPAYDNAWLAVCGAEGRGNLAACFQAAGCPVVVTHGLITFYGRVLALVACALELLLRGGPRSMPRLVDEAWIHLTSRAEPA